MANILERLVNNAKKKKEEVEGLAGRVYDQVNPLDGGKSFQTRQVAPPTQPRYSPVGRNDNQPGFQVTNNSVSRGLSRGLDQFNPFDNNRTWQQRAPTQQKSTFQQAGQLSGQVARAATVGTTRALNTAAAQIPQAYYTGAQQIAARTKNPIAYRNATNKVEAANDMFGKTGGLMNTGTFYNSDEARSGDLKTGLKRIGGGIAESGLEVGTLGVGGIVGRELAKQGIKQGLKTQAPRIVANTALNTAQGGVSAYNQDASVKDIAKSAAFSGLIGTAADVGLGVGGAVASAGARKAAAPAIDRLRNANIIRPANLNPAEVADLTTFRQQAGTGAMMDDATYQRGITAAQKAGVDYRDPTAVDDLLGNFRTFNSRQAVRGQAVRDVSNRLALQTEGGGMNSPKNQSEANAMFGPEGRFSGKKTNNPTPSELQGKPTYRGASKAEWDSVQKTGKFGQQEVEIGNPKGFFNDDVFVVGNKKYAENYAYTGGADGVVIEYKPTASSKVRDTSIEKTTDMGDVVESRGKGLDINDVQRVTDKNGNIIYQAADSNTAPTSKNDYATRKANEKNVTIEEGGDTYNIRIMEGVNGKIKFERTDADGNFMDVTFKDKLQKKWGNLSDEELAAKSVYGNGKVSKQKAQSSAKQSTKTPATEGLAPGQKSVGSFEGSIAPTLEDALAGKSTKIKPEPVAEVAPVTKRIQRAENAYVDERIDADTLEAIRNREITTPKPAPDPAQPGSKVRGFVKTAIESPNTDAPVTNKIKGTYDPISNKDSLAKADSIIDRDFEGAVTRAKTSNRGTTDNQAISLRLMDELQAKGRYEDAIDIVEKTAERATATGQATQILSAYNRLQPEGILLAAEREIRKAKDLNPEKYGNLKLTVDKAAKLRKMAEDVQKMPEGDAKKQATRAMLDEIAKTVPTPGVRKFTTLWKAGLLTGVKGAVGGNNVGNATRSLINKIADVPAAGIDAAIAQATGRRSKTFTLRGLVSGLGEGIGVGFKNFKEGHGAGEVATKLDYKKTFYGDGILGKAAQKYTDTVFNFYSASDRPYYHSALKNNLNDLALTEAKNKGLSGNEARKFVRQTVKEPPEEILSQAHEAAEATVFQNKNALGQGLSGAKKGLSEKGGAGEVVAEVTMPFTGVPSSIATAVAEFSPVGATTQTYKAIKQMRTGKFDQAAQRKFSESLGRGLTGTGIMWLGSQLANTGQMTLGYPSDKQEQALWEAEGKTPYSIQIGDKWRSLNYTGSAMALLAIGGQVDRAKQEGANTLSSIGQGVAASGKAIISSSPLQGIQSALDAVTEPDRYAERYQQNLGSSWVPTIVKDIASAGDKKVREVNSVKDAIQNKIPKLKNNLMEKRDVFGEGLNRKTTTVGTLVDPFKSSKINNSPLMSEIRRLEDAGFGVTPSKIDKKFTVDGQDFTMTPEQLNEFQQTVGSVTKKAWEENMQNPAYKQLSDEDKRKALQNMTEKIRKTELSKFSATNNIGEYSQDFTGKKTKFSTDENRLLNGKTVDFLRDSDDKPTFAEKLETAKTKYKEDRASLSRLKQIKAEDEIRDLEVKKDYDEDTVGLYGMNKTDVYGFLNSDKDGKKLAEKLIAYGDARVKAGLDKTNKFKDKNGNVAIQPKAKGTGRGRGGRKGRGGRTAKLKPSDFKLPYDNLIKSRTKGASLARSAKLAGKRAKSYA